MGSASPPLIYANPLGEVVATNPGSHSMLCRCLSLMGPSTARGCIRATAALRGLLTGVAKLWGSPALTRQSLQSVNSASKCLGIWWRQPSETANYWASGFMSANDLSTGRPLF